MGKNGAATEVDETEPVVSAVEPVNASTLLPVDQLQDWKHGNGRHDYDKAELEGLAASVKLRGVILPLIVRRIDGQGKNGKPYEIVAGHRRHRAAVMAGLTEVPCIVKVLGDDEAKQEQIIENLQRENPHPLDEALGYREFLTKYQTDPETIGAKVGKPVIYIVKRLKLTDLIPEAQKAWRESRRFSIEFMFQLARLQPAQQKAAMKGHAWPRGAEVASPTHIRDWIESTIMLDLNGAPWKKDDANLVPKAGACLTCPKRTGCDKQLFDDISKKETCTDPECFSAKMEAHLAAKEAEIKAKGEDPVRVSTDYYTSAKGVKPHSQWREAMKSDKPEKVKTAIVTDGRGIGQVVRIVEGGDSASSRIEASPAEKAARKRLLAQGKVTAETERRQIAAILDKVNGPIEGENFRLIVMKLWQRTVHESRKHVCKLMEWEAEKNKGFNGRDWEGAGEKPIQEADFLGLCKIAAVLSICGFQGPDGEEILAWGRAYKVDLKKIANQVKAEFDAQKDEKKDAAPKVEDKPKAAKKSSTPAKAKPPVAGKKLKKGESSRPNPKARNAKKKAKR
jgi:ParB family chromosome partitioning protein